MRAKFPNATVFFSPSVLAVLAPEPDPRIYVISCGPFVKIGWSQNVKARMIELQTGAPLPLKLLMTFRAPRHIEREIHKRFAPYRTQGEWYRLEGDLKHWLQTPGAELPLPVSLAQRCGPIWRPQVGHA